MKKRISVLMILGVAFVLMLTGCNKDSGKHTTHVYGEWELTRKATCAITGVETRTCECGEKETRELEKLAHQEVIDEAIEATCTTLGMTEGSHCSVCNMTIREQEVLPPAHKEEKLQAVAVTCTRAGTVNAHSDM